VGQRDDRGKTFTESQQRRQASAVVARAPPAGTTIRAVRRLSYDLAGRLRVSLDGSDPEAARFLAHQMSPFRASREHGRPDIDIVSWPSDAPPRAFSEFQRPARDGMTTGLAGGEIAVLAGERACEVPDPFGPPPRRFVLDAGFPLGRIYGPVVRPAMHVALPSRGAAAVHAAAVERDGRAVLVAGWSESGKTEAALALMEAGAGFLSDKWTVLGGDGTASAFPIGVGVRGWVLPYLPRLRAALPASARRRLRVAAIAAAISSPVRARRGRARLGQLAERAVGMADRAALTPDELRGAYGQDDDPGRHLPLGAVLMLTNIPGDEVCARPADPAWAAARLAVTAAYERRHLFEVLERRRYARALAGESPGQLATAADREVLGKVLQSCQVIEVRTPFPVDPRRVADAASRLL